MEHAMNDLLLMGAGIGGVLISLIHGYLGHTKVLASLTIGPTSMRRVNSAVFQLSTLYWSTCGFLLIAAPFFLDSSLRKVVVGIVVFTYLTGALANFWATRGRHPGWILLVIVSVMALFGA